MDERQISFFISTCDGVGRKSLQKLLDHFGSMKSIYFADRESLMQVKGLSSAIIEKLLDKRRRERAIKQWEQLKREKIQYLFFKDSQYPKSLRELYDFPKHLFVKGELPAEEKISIGVVGARECSYYGRDMARMFGYRLAEAGVNVISGMAKGIDGWAHYGALEGGGKTYAVLGCGVDVCYPARHQSLYDQIMQRGGLLSEFVPGTTAKPNFFPIRNRIISGLSDGILVVEARERSGSLITADAALEQGKDVFVIPGRIGDELSVGCNRLIRQGAVPVLAPEDILEYYDICLLNRPLYKEEKMTDRQKEIYREISSNPMSFYQICEKIEKYSDTEIMKELLWLQREKMIQEVSRGYYVKN